MASRSTHSARDFDWPLSTDIVVLPGIPGAETKSRLVRAPYPAVTVDIVKILREGGLSVEYARPKNERQLLDQKSGIDLWTPILVITQGAIASGAGNLISAAILHFIRQHRMKNTILHVKVGVLEDQDKSIRWFEGSGAAEDVLHALTTALKDPADGLDN